MSPKLWHWAYFQTRAQLYSNPDAPKDFHGNNQNFENTWCTACIHDFKKCANESDEQLLAQGLISEIRSSKELLDSAIKNVHPVSGRREGFEVHIRRCNLIDKEAKTRLRRESTRGQHALSQGSPMSAIKGAARTL
ncbi:unnamed protein product [Rhizoctonia solani]|nr:unnamed protein product [Rhizoctonia solani]